MKLLFVCTANLQRSPTAVDLFKNLKNIKVKSAGIDELCENKINKKLVDWADKIYVMENLHKDFILKRWPYANKKIIILNILDIYYRNDPELIRLLKERVKIKA